MLKKYVLITNEKSSKSYFFNHFYKIYYSYQHLNIIIIINKILNLFFFMFLFVVENFDFFSFNSVLYNETYLLVTFTLYNKKMIVSTLHTSCIYTINFII